MDTRIFLLIGFSLSGDWGGTSCVAQAADRPESVRDELLIWVLMTWAFYLVPSSRYRDRDERTT